MWPLAIDFYVLSAFGAFTFSRAFIELGSEWQGLYSLEAERERERVEGSASAEEGAAANDVSSARDSALPVGHAGGLLCDQDGAGARGVQRSRAL